MLKRFRHSSQSREKEIFACMIHNLFDEYRFFDKYPTRELGITGVLFGALIQHQLVSNVTLGVALRYVLEALQKAPNEKLFHFGKVALEQFKGRLMEWPQYCAHLLQIPHFRSAFPELVAELELNLSKLSPRDASSTSQGSGNNDNMTLGEAFGKSFPPPPTKSEMLASTNEPTPPPITTMTTNTTSQQQPARFLQHQPSPLQLPGMMSSNTNTNVTPSPPVTTTPSPSLLEIQQPPPTKVMEMPQSNIPRKSVKPLEKPEPDHQIEIPDEKLRDQIQFETNNLTKANLHEKAKLIKELCPETYYPWFARYLTVKRVATQASFHPVYVEFLNKMNSKRLTTLVVECAVSQIRQLIYSLSLRVDSAKRNLLKTLGSWLGKITLARNKPVLQKRLDMKELLYDAYQRGRLHVVLPFVAKVRWVLLNRVLLDRSNNSLSLSLSLYTHTHTHTYTQVLASAKASIVFRPPNPWTMALMNSLREIYDIQGLKMFLKFELEVLCKALEVEINTLSSPNILITLEEPSDDNDDLLRSKKPRPMKSPPLPVPKVISPHIPSTSTSPGIASNNTNNAAPMPTLSLESMSQNDGSMIPNLPSYVRVNPSIMLFQRFPDLKRAVPIAVNNAIREIINPVVERSVTIACITAKEMVNKDFALEPDDNRLRKAAQLMASSLAGRLALVTCKDPLRVTTSTYLRDLLQRGLASKQLSPASSNLDATIEMIAVENLELGCRLIEKAATDKANRDIHEAINEILSARQKRRDAGQPHYDMSMFGIGNRFPRELPEPLRPSVSGMQSFQLAVYVY